MAAVNAAPDCDRAAHPAVIETATELAPPPPGMCQLVPRRVEVSPEELDDPAPVPSLDELSAADTDRRRAAHLVAGEDQCQRHRTDRDTHAWLLSLINARIRSRARSADPLVRSLADLHRPAEIGIDGISTCRGCDHRGVEEDAAHWPCLTYRTIAATYGITLEARQ